MQGIFDGLLVLDITNALSGPTLTRLLCEMGADVIKVELPPTGDVARVLPWIRNGRSAYYVQQKPWETITVRRLRKHDDGRELLAELITKVDVFVENFSPGAIDRLGLGWDMGLGCEPSPGDVLHLGLRPGGARWRTQPGYDPIAAAYSGVMHMIGQRGAPPAFPGISPGDVMTGVHGLAGVCAALYHREADGSGPTRRGVAARLLRGLPRDQLAGVVGVERRVRARARRLTPPDRRRVRRIRHRRRLR